LPKKSEKIGDFNLNYSYIFMLAAKMDRNRVYEKRHFCQKMGEKIAENGDHSIDP
jgi:hypothetical protein